MPYPEIARCVDRPLGDALRLVDRFFDTRAILDRPTGPADLIDYYRQSDRGYRLFHSRQGALHIALGSDGHSDTSGYRRQAELFAEHLDATGARHAVELGCGMGYNIHYLAAARPGVTLLGVDLTEPHIRHAKRHARGLANAQFVVGDYERMPYADDTFDAALAVESLCQTTDLLRAMTEARRVLRAGARLVAVDCFRAAPLSELGPPLRRAAQLVERATAVKAFRELGEWTSLAESAGLGAIEIRDLTGETEANLARLYSLAVRFFTMPAAARAMAKAFPPRLLENSVCGLLMPYTVGLGAHTYRAVVVHA